MTTSRKRKVLGFAALAVAVGTVSVLAYRRQGKLEIAYREEVVRRGALEITLQGTGTVQPENRVEIKPPVAGRIEQVLVREGEVVKRGQVLAWMSSTERAALLDAARSQGPEELKKWEDSYRPTPILAPIRGTVISRNVESGQTFTNADPVFVMSDRLTVKAQVDETDIAQIRVKQNARIVLDAYSGEVIPGRVDRIAFEAKTVNNVTTYVVDVLPERTPEFMRSGMTANVTFLVASHVDALLVPNEALRVMDNRYSVLVRFAGKRETVEKPVEIGLTDGKSTEVMQGLSEGEKVLIAEIQSGKGDRSKSANPLTPFAPRRGGR
ncbi:MAG: efflux RND transporter periplasmic adaptor subunit [Oligoflexia bacterium]|nr:efflux RND transporter periplasmic adaptor subunit [Oligoflexia bacterium]